MGGPLPVTDYLAKKGQELGVSEWFLIDQARIDAFAEVTEDRQYIHIDPVRAAESPFGTTIAHGYLTLSMLASMSVSALPGLEGQKMGVNYGFNSVRFLAPVKSGKRVRGRFVLADAIERSPGVIQSTFDVRIEIEGEEKPAVSAQWLTLSYL